MPNIPDFIGVYENAFSKKFCDSAIKFYEKADSLNYTFSRFQENGESILRKDDSSLALHSLVENEIELKISAQLTQEFNSILWGVAYKDYVGQFGMLENFDKHSTYYQRIQKTKIGGGYHVWHCENMGRTTSSRILAWTLYLNDVKEGGETEFLYYHKRIKPKQGTLLIFPAGFTHTHRGNPPISNDKYIITGWIEY